MRVRKMREDWGAGISLSFVSVYSCSESFLHSEWSFRHFNPSREKAALFRCSTLINHSLVCVHLLRARTDPTVTLYTLHRPWTCTVDGLQGVHCLLHALAFYHLAIKLSGWWKSGFIFDDGSKGSKGCLSLGRGSLSLLLGQLLPITPSLFPLFPVCFLYSPRFCLPASSRSWRPSSDSCRL